MMSFIDVRCYIYVYITEMTLFHFDYLCICLYYIYCSGLMLHSVATLQKKALKLSFLTFQYYISFAFHELPICVYNGQYQLEALLSLSVRYR